MALLAVSFLALALPPTTTSSPSLVTSANEEGGNSVRVGGSTVCERYNSTCLALASTEKEKLSCYGNETCAISELDGGHNKCYAVWTTDPSDASLDSRHAHASGLAVKLMGCYDSRHEECQRGKKCVEEDREEELNMGHLFCCCEGDLCNAHFDWLPKPPTQVTSAATEKPGAATRPQSGMSGSLLSVVVVVVSLLALIVCLALGLYVYRKRKMAREGMANLDGAGGGAENPPSPRMMQKNIDVSHPVNRCHPEVHG